ncbi:MAG TPA: amidohydrolase [Planctomycetota bacterium]|nr:amidohydrolase [Planctomycetota bacterium]
MLKKIAWIPCLFALPLFAAESIDDAITASLPALVLKYQFIHSNPELSHYEEKTAKSFAAELRKLGFETTEEVGKYADPKWKCHGVVGVLKNGPGRTVLLRTELDALPIVEQTGTPYASKVLVKNEENIDVGVMHACGHDIHMTSVLGTAKQLSESKDKWSGTVVVVGQPAEETVDGARAMLSNNLYARFPKPDAIVALHCDPNTDLGKIGICPGYCCAAADAVEITVRGIGGHGASPEKVKDPIVISAQLILALQTITSREKSPFDPAVVSVGSIHGGTKCNIIPDEVHLKLTVRTYRAEVRKQVLDSITRIANGVAMTAGLPEDKYPLVKLSPVDHTEATYNDPDFAEKVAASIRKALGAENVVKSDPVMGSEDVGVFAMDKQIPLCYFKLGTLNRDAAQAAKPLTAPSPRLHSCSFAPLPGPAIRTGVRALTSVVLDFLARGE